MTFSRAELVARYRDLALRCTDLGKRVDGVLSKYAKAREFLFHSRIKAEQAFLEKAECGRFGDVELDDVYAASLVVPTRNCVDRCVAELPASIEQLERRDPSNRDESPEHFGFNDTIVICRLREPTGSEPDPESVYALRFEVQVRTLAQYAWGAVLHDKAYKSDRISWGRQRLAAQARALAETVDLIFEQFDELVNAAEYGQSARVAQQVRIMEWVHESETSGLIPSEAVPTDIVRLARTIYELARVFKVDPDEACNWVTEHLDATPYPPMVSIGQLLIGVIARQKDPRWVTVASAARKRGVKFLITEEAEIALPELKDVPAGLRVGLRAEES